MSKHLIRRLASVGLALAAIAVTLLVSAGAALARGPFPLTAARSDLLATGPAFPVVVIPIAICIAIAVIVPITRRQSRATRAAASSKWLSGLPGSRENVNAQAKRAA
jgi:hypothetical protein